MATAHWAWANLVTAAPPSSPDDDRTHEGLGLFALLRALEREAEGKPRIGRNERLRDAIVHLGQDPFLAFPDSDLSRVTTDKRIPMVQARFMGFFGPHGALPLNTTEEVLRWFQRGDDAFVRFTDVFAARFLELFFRAWSDAHAITQFDHPTDDRFQAYLLGIAGTATPAFRNRDSISDTAKARLMPLAGGRVKSPVRLRQMLELHFPDHIDIRIEELVPIWLEFEPDALSRVGMQNSSLGRDMHLGARVRSIGEKITIHVTLPDMDTYHRFLPGGADYIHLRDIVFWYLGQTFEIDVALWLPRPIVPAAILGKNTRLGWMACIAPIEHSGPRDIVCGSIYRLTPGGSRAKDQQAA